MSHLKYSAAAAALVLTGITGCSALAAQKQKEPAQEPITVSQAVCDAFEQAIKATVVIRDRKSKISRDIQIGGVQALLRWPIEELVLQDNSALKKTYTDAVDQSAVLERKMLAGVSTPAEDRQDAVLNDQIVNIRHRMDLALEQSCRAAWVQYVKLGR